MHISHFRINRKKTITICMILFLYFIIYFHNLRKLLLLSTSFSISAVCVVYSCNYFYLVKSWAELSWTDLVNKARKNTKNRILVMIVLWEFFLALFFILNECDSVFLFHFLKWSIQLFFFSVLGIRWTHS